MYTECPTCYTLFRVTTAQLKSAEGRVRCGHCDNVFNAIAYLTDEVPEDAQASADYVASAPSARPGPETEGISTLSDYERDMPAMSARDSAQNAVPVAAFKPGFSSDDDGVVAAGGYGPIDDVFEKAMGGTSTANARGSASAKADTKPSSKSGFDLGAFTEAATSKLGASTAKAPITIIDDLEHENTAEQFVLEELKDGGGRKGFGWTVTLGWSVLIGLLVIVLFGQFVYFKRADLNKYAPGRVVVDAVCAVIKPMKSCEEVLPRDLQAIEVMDRDVRSHPNTKGALLITATIQNKAEFQQPFPDLELSFSDINQKLLAQRRFKPEEYLSPEIDIGAGMKAKLPLRVQIELVDPGPEAVNFEFNFR